jgi:prohibitin 1
MASAASNALTKLAQAAVGIGAGVSLFQSSVYNVDGGFRAVMFDRLNGVQVRRAPCGRARVRLIC